MHLFYDEPLVPVWECSCCGVGEPAQHERAHADVDHGAGHVQAHLVVAHQPAPARHPAECALDDPAARQHLEAFLVRQLADDLQGEALVGREAREPTMVVGAVGEQVLEPRPALEDGPHDLLGPWRVLHVGRGQVDHQQAPIRVHRDVALAPLGPLGHVVAAVTWRVRGLDRLAVQHGGARPRLAFGATTVHHKRQVMDGLKQQVPDQAAESPIHRLPQAEVDRQHAPAAARAREIADRALPLGAGQVSRVAAATLKDKLPCTVLLGPHAAYMGCRTVPAQSALPFSNWH